MPEVKKIFGYSGSQSKSGVGGAMTSGGITQTGRDFIYEAPPLAEDHTGGVFTRDGRIVSSDPASSYYPIRSSVSSLSTTQGKEEVQNLEKDHTRDLERLSVEQNNRATNQDNFKKSAEADDRRNGGLSAEEIASLGANLGDYKHNEASGLYVPNTAGDKPVDDTQSLQNDIDSTFSKQEGLIDASSAALMNSIKQSYQKLTAKAKETNQSNNRGVQSYGARSGVARYTPGQFSKIEAAELKGEISKLDKLATEQNAKLAKAEQALSDKKYTLFAQQRNEITKLRNERMKSLEKIQTAIHKKQDEADKAQIKASREGAIAGVISQGITDPTQILGLINYDEKGNLIGDFSIKEITDTLKGLSPNGTLKDLDLNTRTFFTLKGMGELPPDIEALPEEQQLTAWLDRRKTEKTTADAKITFSEAKAQGLPVSTVGLSRKQVVDSLYNMEVPTWFKEKLKLEAGSVPLAPVVNQIWDEFRKTAAGVKKPTSTTSGRSI